MNGTNSYAILDGESVFTNCLLPFCKEIFDIESDDMKIYPEEEKYVTVDYLFSNLVPDMIAAKKAGKKREPMQMEQPLLKRQKTFGSVF